MKTKEAKIEISQYDTNGIELIENGLSICFVERKLGEIRIRPGRFRGYMSMKELEKVVSLKRSLAQRLK